MDRFDTGRSSTLMEKGIQTVSEALVFPLETLFLSIPFSTKIPNIIQYIPFLLNSLLWGTCIYIAALIYIRQKA